MITLQVSVEWRCVSSAGVNAGWLLRSDNDGVTMVTMAGDNVNTLAVSPGHLCPTLLLLH